MQALGPGDATSPGFRGCSLSPGCHREIKELRCGYLVKAPSGRFFLTVWALGDEKGPPCSHPHFWQPCPLTGPTCPIISWGWSPCVFILSSPALCSFMFTAPQLCLFLELPSYILQAAPCWLELRTKYNLRYQQRHPHMSVPSPRVQTPAQPADRVRRTSAAFIPGEFSFKWKPSPKTRMSGFRKKSVLITGGPPALSLACRKPRPPHHRRDWPLFSIEQRGRCPLPNPLGLWRDIKSACSICHSLPSFRTF